MYIYNVTVNIDEDIAQDWVQWMSSVHIPEVMATGKFMEAKMSRVMVEEQAGITYSIQYTVEDMPTLLDYNENHAPALQEKHTSRYKDKYVAFRTVLEVVETHTKK
ncbi:MAG: DUF4286 family protein [Schleiferiaceae bacterium]